MNLNPLLSSLLHSLWQAGFLWLLVWMVLRFLAARAAALRYRIALSALLLAVLAWLTTWAVLAQSHERQASMAYNSPPVTERLASVIEDIREQTVHAISGEGQARPWRVKLTWQDWVQLAWGAGVLIGFFRVARACVSASRLRRETVPLQDEAWLEDLAKVRQMLRCRTQVALRMGESIVSPVVVGIWRPAIIIPASLVTGVPADVMRAVLAHEVAHVLRRDLLVHLLQMGAEALLFFNPFIWLLNQAVRQEREACCDDMASTWSGGRASYSTALVWWVRKAGTLDPAVPTGALAVSGSGGAGGWLRDRVHRLLGPQGIPRLQSGWAGALGLTVLVALAFAATAGGIHFAVSQISARDRVDLIAHLAEPYRDKPRMEEVPTPGKLREFSGVVVDETGKPLPKLRWTMAWPSRQSRYHRSGDTDEQGRFAGTIDDNVKLYLDIHASNFMHYSQDFKSGEAMKDLRIVLQRGVAFVVKCVDTSGVPLSRVHTTLSYVDGRVSHSTYSDAQGLVRFNNLPDQRLATLTFDVPGHIPLHAKDVTIDVKSQDAPREFRLEKAEPVEITFVDEKDGATVVGAQCSLVERLPQSKAVPWPQRSAVDKQGRVVLEGLHPDFTYRYKAGLQNRTVMITVDPKKDRKMTVRIPAERRVKLRIIHLPPTLQEEVKVEYSAREADGGSGSSATVTGWPKEDGSLEFLLGGYAKGSVAQFYFLRQWFYSPVLVDEVTEYTVDYAKEGLPPEVPVVVRLDAEKQGAPPQGELFVNYKAVNFRGVWDGVSAPIKDGRAEFRVPRGSVLKFKDVRMLGGTVDEDKEYTLSGDDKELVVPVTPAGMVRAQAVDVSGGLVRPGQFLVRNLSRENADMDIDVRPEREPKAWHVSRPLAFDERYDVVVMQGLQVVISPSFKLKYSQPVQDVQLRFGTPLSYRVTVVDESGQPVPGITCIAQWALPERKHARASQHLKTDERGQLRLTYLPEQAGGTFYLRAWSGPYVPQPQVLDVAGGQSSFAVKQGREVRGKLLDRASGQPIAGVDVRWRSTHGLMISNTVITDEAGCFVFQDAPEDQVILDVSGPSGYPRGKGWKGDYYAKPGAGSESVFYWE